MYTLVLYPIMCVLEYHQSILTTFGSLFQCSCDKVTITAKRVDYLIERGLDLECMLEEGDWEWSRSQRNGEIGRKAIGAIYQETLRKYKVTYIIDCLFTLPPQ